MKKIIYTLAFLSVGTFAMAQQTGMPPMRDQQAKKEMMQQKRAEHMAQMQKDLNLTQAQIAQIKAMHEEYQGKREQERIRNQELRKQNMAAHKKDKQQMDDEMRRILTPEQYAKWQAKKQENMQKKQDMMQKRRQLMETQKDRKWGQRPVNTGIQKVPVIKSDNR